jgi:hypothetical protein
MTHHLILIYEHTNLTTAMPYNSEIAMTTQILFAFGLIVSILGWTLISVSDLKADMKLLKYQVNAIHESVNAKDN